VRNARQPETHFDTAERARQRKVVERSKVTDAENPPGELSETCSERHVELLEDDLPESVGVMSLRCIDSREGIGILSRILGDDD
jgi:hypothetical protein